MLPARRRAACQRLRAGTARAPAPHWQDAEFAPERLQMEGYYGLGPMAVSWHKDDGCVFPLAWSFDSGRIDRCFESRLDGLSDQTIARLSLNARQLARPDSPAVAACVPALACDSTFGRVDAGSSIAVYSSMEARCSSSMTATAERDRHEDPASAARGTSTETTLKAQPLEANLEAFGRGSQQDERAREEGRSSGASFESKDARDAADRGGGWRVGLKVAWDVETPAVAVPMYHREVGARVRSGARSARLVPATSAYRSCSRWVLRVKEAAGAGRAARGWSSRLPWLPKGAVD